MQKTSNLNNTEPDRCVWATELAVFTVFVHNELVQKQMLLSMWKRLLIFENMIKDKKNLAVKEIFLSLSLLSPSLPLFIYLSNVQL